MQIWTLIAKGSDFKEWKAENRDREKKNTDKIVDSLVRDGSDKKSTHRGRFKEL